MARCECSPCKLRFTSVTAFDAHLTEAGIGPHVHPSQVPELHQRDGGSWGFEPMDPEALARLHRARAAVSAGKTVPSPSHQGGPENTVAVAHRAA